jgi:hypothetical protein
MSLWSLLSELHYDERDDDLVRFRPSAVDETVARVVRTVREVRSESPQDEGHDNEPPSDDDADLLVVFARRRTLQARREGSSHHVSEALEAYSLLTREEDVPWESWFKAALFIGRELGLDLDVAHRRFVEEAPELLGQRADVAFDALARIETLAQCHVIEVTTTYGPGLLETTVVRDQGVKSWGGITGQPVALGQFLVDFAPTTNLAQLAATLADALEATQRVTCSSIRQDQLIGATFDLVTSGSYLESLGCLSFFADGVDGEPFFSAVVAEVPSEEHYDVHYPAQDLAAELADAADAIEEQSALALGPCVVVLSALPSFEDSPDDDVIDLGAFLDVARAALDPASAT